MVKELCRYNEYNIRVEGHFLQAIEIVTLLLKCSSILREKEKSTVNWSHY